MNTPFGLLVEAVERVDEADRAALVAHDDGHGAGAAAKVLDASHHGRIGNGRRREDAVVAFDHIVQAQNLLAIADAHFQAAFDLFIIFRAQPCLHITAETFDSGSSQNV